MVTINNSTHDKLERRIDEIDWDTLSNRSYTPSPATWEDQVLYFLMLDRFSDGNEKGYKNNGNKTVSSGTTLPFKFPDDAYQSDRKTWGDNGIHWLGGNLSGLKSKIGYLKRMGITAVWISPVFKQVTSDQHSYHGYGIQNFLDVDPHFGTREDLKTLVDTAHAHGIYVILDIIFNHAGDVFGYDSDRYETIHDDGHTYMDPRWDRNHYQVAGYRNAFGEANIPFAPINPDTHPHAWPNDAIWPAELQDSANFTCKGRISSWEYDPEYYEGDFVTLKNIHHGHHTHDDKGNRDLDKYHPNEALRLLCEAYKFWIGYADVDGYRVDTVKHMEIGATRYFTSVIKEFAQEIGKENFYLIGEITGGRDRAFDTLEPTGLDAALGINEIPDNLEYLAKGYRNPNDYFSLFRNSLALKRSSHTWFGQHVITLFDDHDQVRKGKNKARFCGDKYNNGYKHLSAVIGLNLTTIGIPCLYYGTEQGFDGAGENDRFLRECMFGGRFGSLQSSNRHFFNEGNKIYQAISNINRIRQENIALRRGRQYLREISATGEEGSFGMPIMIGDQIRSVVPWSRLFNKQEILSAINTDAENSRTAWVTLDNASHNLPAQLTCLYSSNTTQIGLQVTVEARNGKAAQITVPPGGFVIYR
jgi:glycosidase